MGTLLECVLMTNTPSYITKNRVGTYCFQYVLPSIILSDGKKSTKKLFRKSLKTKNRRNALRSARILWLIMDYLYKKYFNDPVQFGRALELVQNYDNYVGVEWEIVQSEFLDELDELDRNLLDLGLSMRIDKIEDKKQRTNLIADEINGYRKTIDFLTNINPIFETKAINEDDNPKLSFLITKWLETKKESGISPNTYISVEQRINVFQQIILEILHSEPSVNQISPNVIREFYSILKKIPARRNATNLKSLSYIELIKLELTPLSNQSYNEYINIITTFLRWAAEDGFSIDNKLSGILSNNKKNVNDSIKSLPFDRDDLKTIFNDKKYLTGEFKRASDYWVPLIGLFTGARLSEICQLYLTDIRQVEDTWVFDINEDFDDEDDGDGIQNIKRIKTEKASKRLVPIKSELITLGFFEYVELLNQSNQILLFPEEKRNNRGKFDAISKRFNYSIKNIKQTLDIKKRKSFHSFRHTVRTRLVDLGFDEVLIDSTVGHASGNGSVGLKIYTHTDRIKQKKDAINKLNFDLNISLISKWHECIFSREMKRNNYKLKNE